MYWVGNLILIGYLQIMEPYDFIVHNHLLFLNEPKKYSCFFINSLSIKHSRHSRLIAYYFVILYRNKML